MFMYSNGLEADEVAAPWPPPTTKEKKKTLCSRLTPDAMLHVVRAKRTWDMLCFISADACFHCHPHPLQAPRGTMCAHRATTASTHFMPPDVVDVDCAPRVTTIQLASTT